MTPKSFIQWDNLVQTHNLIGCWLASNSLNHYVNQIRLFSWIVIIIQYLAFKLVGFKHHGQGFREKFINSGFIPHVGVHIPAHLEYFHKLPFIELLSVFRFFEFSLFSLYLILRGITAMIIKSAVIINRSRRTDLNCANFSRAVVITGSNGKNVIVVFQLLCRKFRLLAFTLCIELNDIFDMPGKFQYKIYIFHKRKSQSCYSFGKKNLDTPMLYLLNIEFCLLRFATISVRLAKAVKKIPDGIHCGHEIFYFNRFAMGNFYK